MEPSRGGATTRLAWIGAAALVALLWSWSPRDPLAPTAPISRSAGNLTSASPSDPAELHTVIHDRRVSYPVIKSPSLAATEAEKSRWSGAEVCGECHEANWKSALRTGHYLTGRFPSQESLLGEYSGSGARMNTSDKDLHFEMIREGRSHYQRVVEDGREAYRAPINLILGSGKMAQTYGFWVRDALFQLPVTYYTPRKSWAYSPGYENGRAYFARPITSGCLSCHATGFTPVHEGEENYRFKSRHILPGVTCERCHGAGAEHVAHHRAHPEDTQGLHILDPRKLVSSGLNSLCAQCHSGNRDAAETNDKPGAHSNNQLQRLEQSQCHIKSGGMSCTDCHNPHRNERGDHRLFAQRCQKCHEIDDCKAVTPARRDYFASHCAECHMPAQKTDDIELETANGLLIPEIIDHYIRVVRTNEMNRLQ